MNEECHIILYGLMILKTWTARETRNVTPAKNLVAERFVSHWVGRGLIGVTWAHLVTGGVWLRTLEMASAGVAILDVPVAFRRQAYSRCRRRRRRGRQRF